jgi:hypothetical protein
MIFHRFKDWLQFMNVMALRSAERDARRLTGRARERALADVCRIRAALKSDG